MGSGCSIACCDTKNPPSGSPTIKSKKGIDQYQRLFESLKTGDFEEFKLYFTHHPDAQIERIRGFQTQLFPNGSSHSYLDTSMWTPALFAVGFRRLDFLQFIIQELKANPNLVLGNPGSKSEHDEISSASR